jgi:hypothetical protein
MIKGMELGTPTESGRLRIWPIHGPDHNIGFVGNIRLSDDDGGYGQMALSTDHPRGGIAPHGMSFFFAGGQDRALRESTFVPAGEIIKVNALCVEPAQGGFWEGQGTTVKALPASLLAALPSGSEHSYSDLWADIESRYRAMGESGETVSGLLGAGKYVMPKDMVDPEARGVMIAIDGRVISLQIAPNRAAFSEWWNEFGLSESYAFEAKTLPQLPQPLGTLPGELEAEAEGMYQATYLDILKGWIYAKSGQIQFASLLEKEGLTVFKRHGQRADRPDTTHEDHVSDEWEIPGE